MEATVADLWRDPKRGKHHVAPDQRTTLCGRPVPGFWETEGSVTWAEEDLCARCRTRQKADHDHRLTFGSMVCLDCGQTVERGWLTTPEKADKEADR